MTTLIASLIANWRTLVFLLVLSFAGVQSMRLSSTQKDVVILQDKIDQAQIVADNYTHESEKNLDTLQKAIPLMVEQAQKNAVANWKKRMGNAPVCVVPVSVLPSGSTSATDLAPSSESIDGSGQQLLADCAADAARLTAWQQWAVSNSIPVK
jgi:hypothetical protein